MYIHWNSTMETGQPLMDAEHRIMVMLFRKLDVALKTHQTEATLNHICQELKRCVEFHFASEENIMRETRYPEFAAHQIIHTELLMKLNEFVSKIVNHREFHDDLLDFLYKWLIEHIAKEDQQVAEHVRNSMNRPVAEICYPEYLFIPPKID